MNNLKLPLTTESVKEFIEKEKQTLKKRVDFAMEFYKENEDGLTKEIDIITRICQRRVESVLKLFQNQESGNS